MSETLIINFKNLLIQQSDLLEQVRDIFFESSTKKDFKDLKEKSEFEWKYLGFYLSHYPEYAWVAIADEQVLGYVLGMPWSQDPSLYEVQPHLKVFEAFYSEFPAHLHINCHTNSRGKGIGKLLVQKCIWQMSSQNIRGLHIMTGPASDNRLFYQKLGFDFVKELNSILFMGIRI